MDSDGPLRIEPGTVIDLMRGVIGLARGSGLAGLMPPQAGGPPKRLDGHTIGMSLIAPDNMPPHAGERHPDGDEILILVSGIIDVELELDRGTTTVRVEAGQTIVVPQGVWHLIHCVEPGQLVNITPGPRGDYRPLHAAG